MSDDKPNHLNRKWWIAGIIGILAVAIALLILVPALRRSQAPPPPIAGPNGYKALNTFFDGSRDLQQETLRLHELLQYTNYSFPGGEHGLVKALTGGSPTAATGSGIPLTKTKPNMLNLQIAAKVFRAQAVFLLMQGKCQKALNLLADLYHMGRIMAEGNLLIARTVGIAICGISQTGLDLYVLDACETPDDCAKAGKVLDSLVSSFQPATADQIIRRVRPPRLNLVQQISAGKQMRTLYEGIAIRQNFVVARLRLLQLAAAARYTFLSKGKFPKTARDLAPLLPDGPPIDPFADPPAPLRFRTDPATGDFVAYSVGPDGKDQQGKVAYAIGAKTLRAPGDVVLQVPKERKYPFPRTGVHADSAADLKALFPNGLPPDSFSHTRGTPLRSFDTRPVWIYSLGPSHLPPDVTRVRSASDIPGLQYDPTNGIVSDGVLLLPIPGKE